MLYREIIAVCSEIRTKHKNARCGQNVEFLGSFVEWRKVTLGFVLSVPSSAWNNSVLTGRIFTKFEILVFENLSRKFKFE
jgi:hypothetical protein